MGFLHKLWDETVAGPAPDSGLGKLRKCDSFPTRRSPPMVTSNEVPISRSIIILRTISNHRNDLSVDPRSPRSESPTSPITPGTPSTPGTPGGLFKKIARMKSSTDQGLEQAESRSPSAYDWIVISGLDR